MKKIVRLTETDLIKLVKKVLNEEYDRSKLLELVTIISEKYPSINYGGCAVFSRAFHNVTRLPYMLIIDDGLPDEDPPIHVMIKLPNGLFDGEGIRTKKEVKEYYKYDLEGKLLFLEDTDGSILENYYDELGSGLFTTCHKDDYDEILDIIRTTINQ